MGRLNKLINAFGNISAIAEGIKNRVFTKEDVEQIAAIRWSICDTCEFKDTKGDSCAMPGTAPCCADCGCILALKIRSMSASCPKGKWAAFMDDEMEDELQKNI
ncbi:MAG: hypothetical protein GY907_07740 [Bacteroidetes bacterium]|nr:hypothetical protein [Bacteroidota bacterium]